MMEYPLPLIVELATRIARCGCVRLRWYAVAFHQHPVTGSIASSFVLALFTSSNMKHFLFSRFSLFFSVCQNLILLYTTTTYAFYFPTRNLEGECSPAHIPSACIDFYEATSVFGCCRCCSLLFYLFSSNWICVRLSTTKNCFSYTHFNGLVF